MLNLDKDKQEAHSKQAGRGSRDSAVVSRTDARDPRPTWGKAWCGWRLAVVMVAEEGYGQADSVFQSRGVGTARSDARHVDVFFC